MTLVRFKQRPSFASINNLIDSPLSLFPSLYRDEIFTNGIKPSVPVNVFEKENGYVLEIVAPGFEKEQFIINVEQNTLTVTATGKKVEKGENEKQLRKEYEVKDFSKSFTLPELTDAENISAQYVNGFLTLNLPNKQEVKEQTKKITIQ
jgi:HSP20 family protein